MDFHSLTRKELQTLCKKNKIPANITNIAMAEALTALENVVGLEEFINPCQSQSPEKIVPESESPYINPRTVSRTASTRRKPINADSKTAQPMTRTRHKTPRRTIIDQDQDDKKSLMETPAISASRRRAPAPKEHEISDNNMMETPVVLTNRRRQPSGSVQPTRQSVRLLEKSLAELSLKDKGRAKPVRTMDVSAASFEKTNDTQVSSHIELLENKDEMKEDVQRHQNKSDDQEENNQNSDILYNHVSELIAKNDQDDDETFDDLLTDKSNQVTNEIVSVALPVTEFLSENGNASEGVMEPEQCLADKVSEENSETGNASEEVMEPEQCLADKVSEENSETGNASEDVMEPEQCLMDKISEENTETGNASEEVMEPEQCLADKVSEENSESGNASKEVTELEHFLEDKVSHENSAKVMDNHYVVSYHAAHEDDSLSGRTKIEGDLDSTVAESSVEKEMPFENVAVALNSPKVDTEKELVDVTVIEAQVLISNEDETSKFVKQISLSYEENMPLSNLAVDSITENNPDSTMKNLVDVCDMQSGSFGKQMSDGDSVSGSKFTCRNSMSPLGADPLQIQFSRPTQSSSKKQATNEKLTIPAADNKENIDSSGMKVESKKDKVKKNKNIVDKDMMLKSLEEQSLRQLTKLLKQKLQINNNEETIVKQQQLGNTRPALQSLAENVMLPGEPKNEI